MARDTKKNLYLTVNVEYDVQNFKKLPEDAQIAYDQILNEYGKRVIDLVQRTVGSKERSLPATGPGPHDHRSELIPPEHNFKWTDTGQLGDAVHYKVSSRGFIRNVEIFVDPIEVDGRLVDYGTFLEIGWHPLIPIKGGGLRPSGKFYSYPWLSQSIAIANSGVLKEIMKSWKTIIAPMTGQVQVFGKGRSASGKGQRANKFVFKQNITAETMAYKDIHEMTGFLKSVAGVKVPGNIFFP